MSSARTLKSSRIGKNLFHGFHHELVGEDKAHFPSENIRPLTALKHFDGCKKQTSKGYVMLENCFELTKQLNCITFGWSHVRVVDLF